MTKLFGENLPDWTAPAAPTGVVLGGRYVTLEPLDADRHTADLYTANIEDTAGAIWDYMPYGPFSSQASYHKWVRGMEGLADPFFYAIRNLETGRFCGVASYLRIKPAGGSIEVGHINFAPSLQRTRAATEAMYLMMKWAFEAGYRRYEWKCDALNIPSRRAGQRLGLSYEGVFRQATVVKGRNRDTAWLATIDKEWPALEAAFEAWLAPSNFDADGRQVESLADLTGLVRVAADPAVK
ncbi:MAG: GNAT family N-acetyltransferase [Rhodobacteraceae bacterium]|nr:GNAT family N-acetyltransferase [Paracoccaceae bacterium]